MAQKRMFDKRVVESDKFTDLPNSSKALYFMAGMSADDRGFFQPRRLQKMCGFTDDDFKILIAKGFFIAFPSGVMVVTDWNKNNWLDSRRVTETEYVDELNLLKLINEKYELLSSDEFGAKRMLSENSIEENSIEENSIDIMQSQMLHCNNDVTESNNVTRFKKPTLLEVKEYCKERGNNIDANQFYDYYETNNWKDKDGKQIKNWKQKMITWESKEKKGWNNEKIRPSWLDYEPEKIKPTDEERQEIEDLLSEYK